MAGGDVMSTHVQPYIVSFPEGFDEQAEFELPYRGYLPDVIVGSEGGSGTRGSSSRTDAGETEHLPRRRDENSRRRPG
jgi:hypothetical protein